MTEAGVVMCDPDGCTSECAFRGKNKICPYITVLRQKRVALERLLNFSFSLRLSQIMRKGETYGNEFHQAGTRNYTETCQ